MELSSLKEAIETGHKASSVLKEVLQEMVDDQTCPAADGFEGRETFFDCGECVYCLAKKLIEENNNA